MVLTVDSPEPVGWQSVLLLMVEGVAGTTTFEGEVEPSDLRGYHEWLPCTRWPSPERDVGGPGGGVETVEQEREITIHMGVIVMTAIEVMSLDLDGPVVTGWFG